jgi:surface antigen
MKSKHTSRRTIGAAVLAVLGATVGMVVVTSGVSPASAVGTGRIMASPCLNARSGPNTSAPVQGCIPNNVSVAIDCTATGTAVNGYYGTESLWDHTSYGGFSGYVSDSWVYTGTSQPVAPTCGAVAPPPVTAGRAMGQTESRNLAVAGQCTWGALEQWHNTTGYYPYLRGNAKDWAGSARAHGWTVVADAQPRSIVVFQPGVQGADRTYGHVAWVVSTQRRSDGLYITMVEMNGTAGAYHYDTRTLKDIAGMSYILAP